MPRNPTFTFQQATYRNQWRSPGQLYQRKPRTAMKAAWLESFDSCFPLDYPNAYFFHFWMETHGNETILYRAGTPVLKVTKITEGGV